MEVIRAQRAGACYGVKRALDMAYDLVEHDTPAYSLGSLIHNPQVVADLSQQGVRAVDDISAIPANAQDGQSTAVIIRSHGVTPEVLAEVEAAGYDIVDATCPHVARAQKAAAELANRGARVIVLGEAGHPEVQGLQAWALNAGAKADVVGSPDDIPVGLYDPVGVVVQTTQKRATLDAVVEALTSQGLHPIVKNTICAATSQRQEAAAEVAAQFDAMVIIGGRNSSNTTRLAEICEAACPRSYHIESADELRDEWFEGCTCVGVTAGASTPEEQIAACVVRLEQM